MATEPEVQYVIQTRDADGWRDHLNGYSYYSDDHWDREALKEDVATLRGEGEQVRVVRRTTTTTTESTEY